MSSYPTTLVQKDEKKVHVGCSGWSYEDWVGPFYPKDSKPKDYLKHYSSVFNAVEIDSSFYRIPNQFMVSQWKRNTQTDFIFCPKFPKKITHELKLQNVDNALSYFYKSVGILGDKLGPLVVQLPPSFKYDKGMPVLSDFVSELKEDFRHAIEFRHKSWFREDVYKLLASHKISFCWSLNQYVETPKQVTSDFVYVRMVGERDITRFDEIQKDRTKQMKEMSESVKDIIGSVDDAFIFFNNHFAGFGPESVNEFRRLLGLMQMEFRNTGSVQDSSTSYQKSLADF